MELTTILMFIKNLPGLCVRGFLFLFTFKMILAPFRLNNMNLRLNCINRTANAEDTKNRPANLLKPAVYTYIVQSSRLLFTFIQIREPGISNRINYSPDFINQLPNKRL